MIDNRMNAQDKVNDMLTENVGCSILDSGGAFGRHFQENSKKHPVQLPEVWYESHDGKLEFFTVNLAHYLPRILVNDQFAEHLDNLLDELSIHQIPDLEEKQEELKERLQTWGHDPVIGSIFNTYNGDEWLSQVLQFAYIHFEEESYVLLQIHGGADVRGGYTDFRAFRADAAIEPTPEVFIECKERTLFTDNPMEIIDIDDGSPIEDRVKDSEIVDIELSGGIEDRARDLLEMERHMVGF